MRAATLPGTTSGRRRVITRSLHIAVQQVTAQPAGLVVVVVFYLGVTSILSGVWRVAAVANGGVLAGYGATALVWYIATAEAAVNSLPLRLIDDIGGDIGNGRYEVEMSRPLSPLTMRLTTEIGRALPRLGVIVIAGLIFVRLTSGPPPDYPSLALAVPALLMAVMLNLMAAHAFAATSFWVLDARGAWFLYTKLVFVLGGMLIPLEMLPDGLATVARLLPFSAMAYVPARLASGHFEPGLLLIQVAWLVTLTLLAHRVFTAGERHLTSTGG